VSTLVGIELLGDAARLVVVDRKAKVLLRREEQLSSPVREWWSVHPDERVRATLGLLSGAVAEGLLRPAEVAAIGITAEPALALLDADLTAIPPRDLPWGELDPAAFHGRPWDAVHALFSGSPRAAQQVGLILDLVGYLRYRLTGALATQVDFAWKSGHIAGPDTPASWSTGSLEDVGLFPAHLPPIFTASQRVSVVGEETIERTGLRRGTWVCAGGHPRNTRLLFAGEPIPGRTVLLVEGAETIPYECVERPATWAAELHPTALEGIYFRRGASIPTEEVWAGGGPEGSVVDVVPGGDVRFDGAVETLRIAADAGEASAGTALVAGLGLGWWRDPRPIWRKRRPPVLLADLRAAREVLHEGEDRAEETSEASDV
jgi:hypothetical protein